ncbi:MAG: class I SAM-dependent methyltransferase [Bacteroidota bacterium]|nr:class I SAM-dependent methyltransferase [Bacteroidota bacterium]
MHHLNIHSILGNTDIYLVDQIMKGRYAQQDLILDAGCGDGRNMHWFINTEFLIYGIDSDAISIKEVGKKYPSLPADRLQVSAIENMKFSTDFFDHIIVSAVLHFAKNSHHFFSMLEQMLRVIKPGGSIFIRMASDIGIEKYVREITEGVYLIPDGSKRFLLTRYLLSQLMEKYNITFLEEFKTVNVNDIRCMSTMMVLCP